MSPVTGLLCMQDEWSFPSHFFPLCSLFVSDLQHVSHSFILSSCSRREWGCCCFAWEKKQSVCYKYMSENRKSVAPSLILDFSSPSRWWWQEFLSLKPYHHRSIGILFTARDRGSAWGELNWRLWVFFSCQSCFSLLFSLAAFLFSSLTTSFVASVAKELW